MCRIAMEISPTTLIGKQFTIIEDPRKDRTWIPKLADIQIIEICAMIFFGLATLKKYSCSVRPMKTGPRLSWN